MSRRWSRPARALVAALAVTAALGACGDDDDDEDEGGASSTTTTTAAAAADATTTTGGGDGSTTTNPGGGGGAASTTTSAPPAGDGSSSGDGVIVLTINGGAVEGGVRRETVKQNSQVTLRATSDVAEELHLHGYDLKTDLVPGQSADLTFLARIPGVFEVELEGAGKKVLELEVRP
jgi:hypothetical protein